MKVTEKEEIFKWDGNPGIGEAMPLSLQHVVAMVAGCITPALIVSGVAGLEPSDSVLLVQMSLVMSGIATLIMLFPIFGKIGAKLPVIIGVSFSYVPTMTAVAGAYAAMGGEPKHTIAVILGAQLIGGIVAIIFGLTVKYIKILFPPVVTGTVILVIGFSLYPIALRYMGGAGSVTAKGWGEPKFWIVGIITLVIGFVLNNFTKGLTKLASVLFAMIVGYIISIPFGMVDVSKVGTATWFKVATPLHFGIAFEPAVIVSFVILFVVNSIQAIGDLSSTTIGGMDREATVDELQGGIIGYGFTNILGAFTGCLATATFSQNVGIVGTNKVIARKVFSIAAIIIIIAGFIPKLSALLTTIPYPVIGGATLSVFAIISMNGLRLIAKQPLTYRNTNIVGISVAIGVGFANVALEAYNSVLSGKVEHLFINKDVYTVIGTSPVVLATICAVILNLVLKETDADRAKE